MHILPKIRLFAWRIGHDILPTNTKIAAVNPRHEKLCPRCKTEEETLIQALKNCPKARAVLMSGGIDW